MATRIHFWSDIPGKFGFSGKHDARLHGHQGHDAPGWVEAKVGIADRPGAEDVLQVTSIVHLIQLLDQALKANKTYDLIDFHSHGGPGSIDLGNDSLGPDELQKFKNKGFEKLFNRNGR
jgi:hypothetical protein